MNCQQGDLAMIVRMPSPPCCAYHDALHRSVMGKIGRCAMPVVNETGVLWMFEDPIIGTDHVGGKHEMIAIGDKYLQPLKNPGDDEQDEIRPSLPVEGTSA